MRIEENRREKRMNRFKIFSRTFGVLAILLSQILCAVVAYHYCRLQWAGRYAGWSAPAYTAIWYAVPFAAGIGLCVALSWLFHKREKMDSGR